MAEASIRVLAPLPGEDLRFPWNSFSSAVADFNNDGWQDLALFAYGPEFYGPYGNSHGLFLNRKGQGFYNVAAFAGINRTDGEPPSGCVQFVARPVSSPASPLVVEQDCVRCSQPHQTVETWLEPADRRASGGVCEGRRVGSQFRRDDR